MEHNEDPFTCRCSSAVHYPAGRAQTTTYDLEVDVVMDTVLYDGFNGNADQISEGFRRYKLYAVVPDGAVMLGPAADNVTIPNIPAFGFQADCGCYDSPLGTNTGWSLNSGFVNAYPELGYDTWWTTYLSEPNSLIAPRRRPGHSRRALIFVPKRSFKGRCM